MTRRVVNILHMDCDAHILLSAPLCMECSHNNIECILSCQMKRFLFAQSRGFSHTYVTHIKYFDFFVCSLRYHCIRGLKEAGHMLSISLSSFNILITSNAIHILDNSLNPLQYIHLILPPYLLHNVVVLRCKMILSTLSNVT